MWSYYGSKSKIVHLYPAPIYPKIIEAFAGTARYSLRWWWKHEVLLVDKYPVIVDIWKWLQQTTEDEILSLPKLKIGERIPKSLTEVEKAFMGFLVNTGVSFPRNIVVSSGRADVEKELKRISKQLFKIRDWEIILEDYRKIYNEEATWFIDPPYQFGGEGYIESNFNINFTELADWCKTRKGQVIVCENDKADWLPFHRLKNLSGSRKKSTEVIWSNLPTPYDAEQLSIFDILREQ